MTRMLFVRALSRTPNSSSHVISPTMRNAGRLIRIGMPATWGALCSRLWTAESGLSSAVRYPVVIQTGRWTPKLRINVLK